MTEELEVTTQEPLEERQMVWALESSKPGRLCALAICSMGCEYIHVFRSERDALSRIASGNWLVPTTGIKPIELSLESVIQQVKDQKPGPVYRYLCAGYAWMPEEELVEVPR